MAALLDSVLLWHLLHDGYLLALPLCWLCGRLLPGALAAEYPSVAWQQEGISEAS
ncbi:MULTISPECIES: hypothetical protein [Rhodanobacter]|uniref:hypothetical protein n=1 Tax=Rhodanobacter TaxID=75309 RepID=UPI0004260B35|nr:MULTISPECIES: hypothetical protein [Rhodanobacter]UJJ55813.1 hypothetical protein LRK53_05370 [Rhodanobacter thiooxydans]